MPFLLVIAIKLRSNNDNDENLMDFTRSISVLITFVCFVYGVILF